MKWLLALPHCDVLTFLWAVLSVVAFFALLACSRTGETPTVAMEVADEGIQP